MSKKNISILVFFLATALTSITSAQNTSITSTITSTYKRGAFFLDAYIGTQVSGIRKEDYVSSNFAPYFQVSIGKVITQNISLNINFQGPYFNFIGDNNKHSYQFLGSDLIVCMNRLFNTKYSGNWYLYLFAGPGILFNNYLNKTNLCFNGGLINEYRYKSIGIKLKISAIGGYKIYQHDKDALTNISIGISKYF